MDRYGRSLAGFAARHRVGVALAVVLVLIALFVASVVDWHGIGGPIHSIVASRI